MDDRYVFVRDWHGVVHCARVGELVGGGPFELHPNTALVNEWIRNLCEDCWTGVTKAVSEASMITCFVCVTRACSLGLGIMDPLKTDSSTLLKP